MYEVPHESFDRVQVDVLQEPECVAMMAAFIEEHPDLWNEDIGE
jgi:cytosine/creatinine deaminase